VVVVVIPGPDGSGRARSLDGPGVVEVPDLARWMAEEEARTRPRWVLPAVNELYPMLLRAGVRLARCHDLTLIEGLLLSHEGRPDRPRNPAAALARLRGLDEPEDPAPRERNEQPALFETERPLAPEGVDPMDAAVAVYQDQRDRLAASARPHRLRLLAAAESAGALAAAEMSHHGLPWREDVHRDLLTELVGPRPAHGARPRKLAELADRITEAFQGKPVNPDHPPSVVHAFAMAGVDVASSRAWVLREVDHPAVPLLLEYKELSRLYVAHGWSWLDTWVRDGRFRPEYVVGGVVSGRWATRGGAALQLPKTLRTAVRADPGWVLVVADAAALEPRVLAALAEDRELAEVSRSADLYTSLAEDSFAGDRGRAKIAMLSAMYGGTSGEAGPLLAVLRRRFPRAVGYVEHAARCGEEGELVRSRLGRTSPPPPRSWRDLVGQADADEATQRRSLRASREWGRFTRNFVVQASAADWALALLAVLRRRLRDRAEQAEIVFFQHDEVLVHCPRELAAVVCAELSEAAEETSDLVFGPTAVRFPLQTAVVDCYADAK
jgi:DNA polymerase-1